MVRIGSFNLVSDGKYLEFVPETGRLVELQRQPQSRYTKRAAALEDISREDITLDPVDGLRVVDAGVRHGTGGPATRGGARRGGLAVEEPACAGPDGLGERHP